MSSKRIEQLIDDVYEFVDSCKPKGFSSTQVIVSKDELFDLLDEMRLKIPDEIKRCQKMIANRDAIIANAEERAAKIIEDAKRQAEALVQENEIMRQAYLQANDVVLGATQQAEEIRQTVSHDAEQIRTGALAYTNDMLGEIERLLSTAYEETRVRSEGLLNALHDNLDIIMANRQELTQEVAPEPQAVQTSGQGDYEPEEEGYDIDPDSFMRNT